MDQPLLYLSGLVGLGFYGFTVRGSSRSVARTLLNELLFSGSLFGRACIGEPIDPLAHYRNCYTGGRSGHTNDRQQRACSGPAH